MKKKLIILLAVFIQTLLSPLFAVEVVVEKAGKLKKILSKEHLFQVDSLSIIGEINGTDILTLKEMSFLEYLDLRKCRIKQGGKVYYRNKEKKLKLKTSDNILSPYLFDKSFSSLKSIVLPESLLEMYGNGVLCDLDFLHLTSSKTKIHPYSMDVISVLDSVDMINCFSDLGKSLQHIQICKGSIRDEAFMGYENLKTIVIHKDVSNIGKAVFKDCSSLMSVKIYAPVKSLKESTFEGCKSLKKLQLYFKLEQIGDKCFYSCSSLEKIKLPNSVGCSAFEDCTALHEIEFSDELLGIKSRTFKGCSSLEKINLPNSITTIEYSAFENCIALHDIELSDRLSEIASETFKGCSSLEKIDLPNSITTIGRFAFKGCTALHEIRFSNNLLQIGDEAFCDTNLSTVKLPDSLSALGDNVWSGCPLKRIEYPQNIIQIGKNDYMEMDDLSIYMNSRKKPLGTINGFYTTIYIPKGSFKNYSSWSDQAYVVDPENSICKTIELTGKFDVKDLYYADTLKLSGIMNFESFKAISKKMRMIKCLDLSNVKYIATEKEIATAHTLFLEEEKKRESDKSMSELLGLVAGGVSLYAEYFMGPLTGTVTKVIADEVQKSMDKDVKEYKKGVFHADTVTNHLTLDQDLQKVKNLSSIYLPSNVKKLSVYNIENMKIYVRELPPIYSLKTIGIKNVQFIIPSVYKEYISDERRGIYIFSDTLEAKKNVIDVNEDSE